MKVLVTGGTGYLGRALVRALAAHGHEPVVFARRALESGLPGTLVRGDLLDPGAVDRACTGCDAVMHAAAHVSIWERDPTIFTRVNVEGLRTTIAAVERHRIPTLLYTSSFLALPPAGRTVPLAANDYQRTKAEALDVALEAIGRGVPLTCLYPGVLYGPGVESQGNLVGRLLADHRAGRLPGLVGPNRIWSYSFVEDVARGHVAALERAAPGTHWMLGGENQPQVRAFELAAPRVRRRRPRTLPYWLADLAAMIDEHRARLTGRPPLITRGAVEIFRHDWPLDSSLAAHSLGYRITPLADGVARTLDSLP